MKKILDFTILAISLTILGLSSANADKAYKITVTNLTRGQVMSPILALTHNRHYRLFKQGEPAIDGLAALAQDADSSVLKADLSTSDDVLDVVEGGAPFKPGASQTVIIHARGHYRWVSLASMLVTTNDGFYALNSVRLPKGKRKVTYTVPAYDAGSEDNNELCAYIPGPPCGNAFQASGEGGEGFVHIHAGIHRAGDPTIELDAAAHDWRNPVASISIQKIHYYAK